MRRLKAGSDCPAPSELVNPGLLWPTPPPAKVSQWLVVSPKSALRSEDAHTQRLASSPAACDTTPEVRSKGLLPRLAGLRKTQGDCMSFSIFNLAQLASTGCTLEPPGELLKKWMPRTYPRPITSVSGGRGGAGASVFVKPPSCFQPEAEFEKG